MHKETSVLISIKADLIPPGRCYRSWLEKHAGVCAISTHLAVKKTIKPFKLVDNEPGKIRSKRTHTKREVKHELVRSTDRLKGFAAGQQDHEMQFVLASYQNPIVKISLTPLELLAPWRKNPWLLLAGHTNQGYYTLNSTLITAQKPKHAIWPHFRSPVLPYVWLRCLSLNLLLSLVSSSPAAVGIRCIWTSFEHQRMHRAIFSQFPLTLQQYTA